MVHSVMVLEEDLLVVRCWLMVAKLAPVNQLDKVQIRKAVTLRVHHQVRATTREHFQVAPLARLVMATVLKHKLQAINNRQEMDLLAMEIRSLAEVLLVVEVEMLVVIQRKWLRTHRNSRKIIQNVEMKGRA